MASATVQHILAAPKRRWALPAWTKRTRSPGHLSYLPVTIAEEILSYLDWPSDLACLARVSKSYYYFIVPRLYETVVIAYLQPERTYRMLCGMKSNPDLCSYVKKLVLDDTVKPRHHKPAVLPSLTTRRSDHPGDAYTSDTHFPNSAHHKRYLDMTYRVLRFVLPRLMRLECVVLKRPHPHHILSNPSIWRRSNHRRVWKRMASSTSDFVRRQLGRATIRPEDAGFGFWGTYKSPFALTEVLRLSNIRTLVVTGHIEYPLPFGFVRGLERLDTLIIHDVGHQYRSDNWNRVLKEAKGISTLCISNVGLWLPDLFDGCEFKPGLRSIQLFEVRATHMGESPLSTLLQSQSDTLEIIAISVMSFVSTDWGSLLRQDTLFPKLTTLRLENIGGLEPWFSIFDYNPDDAYIKLEWARHGEGIVARCDSASKDLVRFVSRHPALTDISVSGVTQPCADEIIAECRNSNREMKRLLVGNELQQDLRGHGVRFFDASQAKWRAWYRLDWWRFYRMLFEGLEMEHIGWTPKMRKRSWRDLV